MSKTEMIINSIALSGIIDALPSIPDDIWQEYGYIFCESEVVAYLVSNLLGMLMGEKIPVFRKDGYYVVNAYGDIDD